MSRKCGLEKARPLILFYSEESGVNWLRELNSLLNICEKDHKEKT